MSPERGVQGTTLHLRRTIAAPRDAVFHAWTDSGWLGQWFGTPDASIPRADLDVRVGGEYQVEFETPEGTSHLFGTYLEVRRPERLVYTFCWGGPPGEIPETQVTVEFHERGAATEIVITHERQPSSRVQDFHAWGWTVSIDRLSELLDRAVADSPRAT